MTLAQLNEYREDILKLKENEALLVQLKSGSGLKSPGMSDMPRSPGVSDKVGTLAIEIADIEAKNAYLIERATIAEGSVREFTKTIVNDVTRLIFNLRFINCLSWAEVAEAIGGRNNETSVKKICYRYLNLDGNGLND